MYKTYNWNQKQLAETLQNIYGELSNHVHLYKFRTDIIYEDGYRKDNKRVADTLNFFLTKHPEFSEQIKASKGFFQSIKKYDKLIYLDHQHFLKHSYILLMHIHQYLHLFQFYMDGSFKKNTFASFRGDKVRYGAKHREHDKRAKEIDALTAGPNNLMSFIYGQLFENHDIADAFINQCTLFPTHQYKDLEGHEYEVQIMKRVIEFFGSSYFGSVRPIYKSLAIILVAYLTWKMNVPHKTAIDAVQTLFDDLFFDAVGERYTIDGSANKLLSNVYIYGRLDGLPIFGSSDEENQNLEILDALESFNREAKREIGIDMSLFDYKTYCPLNKLPSVYLSLAPVELLQPYT